MDKISRIAERLTFLDCVRGLAALFVVFEHAGDRLSPAFRAFTHNSFSFGKFGVATFFLTSGFIIPFSLERGGSLKRFWISRFFRLYPLYWLSIALVVGLHFLGGSYTANHEFAAHLTRNTLVNLTMFQEYVGVPDAEGLYYTLAMEMAFYICFSVLYVAKLNRESFKIAWFGCGLLTTLGILMPVVFHRRVPLAGLFYFLCLFVGTSIYRHYTGEASRKALTTLLICFFLTTTAQIYCNYVLVKKDDVTEHYTFWAVFLPWACAGIFFLLAYRFRQHSFPRVFVWLGTVSYSVYLLHSPLAGLVPVWPYRIFSFVGIIALALAAAALTYNFVEQPFIAFGKKMNSKSKVRSIEIKKMEELRSIA